MADDAVNTACHQCVARLDRDEPAEPAAEHKDRPDAQDAANSEKSKPKPAGGIAVDGPNIQPVGIAGK